MKLITKMVIDLELAKHAWRDRRDEDGGVMDETAMIFVAIGAAGAIAALVAAAISSVDFSVDNLWPGG